MATNPVAWSHFNDPSRDRSPVTPEQKNIIINKIIEASGAAGLNKRETAHVLALVEFESGFNPNAANPSSSAVGLGQFIDSTGKKYHLEGSDRWDVDAQISAVIKHFQENKLLAEKNNLGEAGIYGAHHDGAAGVLKDNAPGLELAEKKVLPKIDKFEKLIDQKTSSGEVDVSGISSSVKPSGHWEDSTQYDAMGNVTVPGERIWGSDKTTTSSTSSSGSSDSSSVSTSTSLSTLSPKPTPGPAGDSLDADLPDGTRVVSTSITVNGQTTVTAQLLDKAGQVLLTAGAGQTMERDPDTGIVQVRTGTSDYVQQFDPATGEVSQALRTGSDAAHVYQNLLDAFSNPQSSAGEGEQLVDASGGLPEASRQATSNTFSNYLETQGVSQITQAQASALFNSLMAANNWDHLSDLGKLSALVNLFNATDKLGDAARDVGDKLPDGLGTAAGYLQLVQGLQSGDNLVIANSINSLSDHALDKAMNEAFGSNAAGEAVPYLSYALAIRNFADNPEQAMLKAGSRYLGEAANNAHLRKAA